jgi:hypothetical protein
VVFFEIMCGGVKSPAEKVSVRGDDVLVEGVGERVRKWVCFSEEVLPPDFTGLFV